MDEPASLWSQATFSGLAAPYKQNYRLEAFEKLLLEGCLRRDGKAQKQLYERYKIPISRLCLRYSRNRHEAEDLLQEGFIRVFSDMHQFEGKGALGAWIRRVMINVALQHLRKQKNIFSQIAVEQIADSWEADENIFSSLHVKELTIIIQQLPVGYRTVFNLFVIEGYSHREIAQMLNISVNTSKSQLSKAKATLRRMLVNIGAVEKEPDYG